MEKKEQKSSGGLLVAIIILLLLAIGVLLWLLLQPKPEPAKIPTGNVDIFDIKISCLCVGKNGEECDEGDEDDEATPGPDGYKSYSGSTINGHDANSADYDDGVVFVDDINGWYVYQQNLKIFENAAFEYTNTIAPGVSNSYDFKIHNETKKSIRYGIEFEENSDYAVNMKYRLKRGDTYVIGGEDSWVSADELNTALKALSSDGIDSYTLDWSWPYEGGKDAIDTEAGEKMTSEYSLGIKVNFEEA